MQSVLYGKHRNFGAIYFFFKPLANDHSSPIALNAPAVWALESFGGLFTIKPS